MTQDRQKALGLEFNRTDRLCRYGDIDVEKTYDSLPQYVKSYLGRLEVTSEDIRNYRDAGAFGVVEEAGDLLLELYVLQACRQGIITPERVEPLIDTYVESKADPQNPVPFFDFLNQILDTLGEEDIRAFQKFTRLQGEEGEERSKLLLALMMSKAVMFTHRNPDFDMRKATRRQAFSEGQELAEASPRFSPNRLKLVTASFLASHLKMMPLALSRRVILNYVDKKLGLPITETDLMRYVFLKQVGRQGMDYEQPLSETNLDAATLRQQAKKRSRFVKSTLKHFELMYEADILNKAKNRALVAQSKAG